MIHLELKNLKMRMNFRMLVVIVLAFVSLNMVYLKSTGSYDALFKEYSKHTDLFTNDSVDDATMYFEEQIKYISGYHENIDQHLQEINDKRETGLFEDPKDVHKLNKEHDFYEQLKLEPVEFINIQRHELILRSPTPKIVMLLFGFYLLYLLFGEDLLEGTLEIYQPTQRGLSKLFHSKMVVLTGLLFVVTGLLILFDGFRLGFSKASIHSIPYFKHVWLMGSVFHYSMFRYISIFVVTLMLLLLTLIFMTLTRNTLLTVIAGLSVYFVQGMQYALIPIHSKYGFLKFYNMYFMVVHDKGDFPNNLLLFSVVLTGILGIVSYQCYVKSGQIRKHKGVGIPVRSTHRIVHSMYQLWISSYGLIILVFVLMFGIYSIKTFSISTTSNEQSYQLYKQNYLGPIDDSSITRHKQALEIIQEAVREKEKIQIMIEREPERAHDLYVEHDAVFKRAHEISNALRFDEELKQAQMLGVDTMIDNRGASLIVMKNQVFYRLIFMGVLLVPMFFLGYQQYHLIYDRRNESFIHISRTGMKNYRKTHRYSLLIYSMMMSFTMIAMHILKISKVLNIDFSNTMKDLLITSIPVTLKTGVVLVWVMLTLMTYGIGRIGNLMYLIQRNVFNDSL